MGTPMDLMMVLRKISRGFLGLALVFAGVGHLSFARSEFQAQVPVWLPVAADFIVVASGIVEIMLGVALLLRGNVVPLAGLATAIFFIAIFPGNINQYSEGINAFGLDTDEARLGRLFFQPLLVVWALWSTSAISWLKSKGQKTASSRTSDTTANN
jgi:uncharacterized membrane protein